MADDKKRITKDFLKKMLRGDIRNYYTTPELNETLYLHYKGFDRIESLEEFTGLRVIYLEGNGFTKIEGLETCVDLRCLYLQENLIKKMEGLETLAGLYNLNLTDNLIESIEGLSKCTKLNTLQLKRNRIGEKNGLNDVKGLLECPSIAVLDISENRIEDENILGEVFEKMPNLGVLYTQGNNFCKKIPHYRKTMIAKLTQLKYLDDRPVFPEDRRFAEAFQKGGLEAERLERAAFKKEEEDKHLKNHLAFKDMIDGYKKQHEEERKLKEAEDGANEENKLNESVGSEPNHTVSTSKLSTYNSEENGSNQDQVSTPNSTSSSRKKFALNESNDNVKTEEASLGSDSDLEKNSKGSRRDSVDTNENKEAPKASSSSQYDELE
jgi:dynein assembly factor 1